jgi:hypothetical protein
MTVTAKAVSVIWPVEVGAPAAGQGAAKRGAGTENPEVLRRVPFNEKPSMRSSFCLRLCLALLLGLPLGPLRLCTLLALALEQLPVRRVSPIPLLPVVRAPPLPRPKRLNRLRPAAHLC